MSFRTPPTSPTKKTPGTPMKKKKPPHQFQTKGTNLDHKLGVAAGVTQQMPGGRRRRKSKRKSHKKSHKKKRKTKRRRKSRKKRTKRRRRR